MRRLTAAILLACGLAWAIPCLGGDGLAWKEVLAGIDRDLDRRAAEVEQIATRLPQAIATARAALSQTDNQHTQALILRGVAGDSPWSLRTLLAHSLSLEKVLADRSQKLRLAKDHLSRIKDENATIRDIRRRSPDNDYNNATVAALGPSGEKMGAIKNRVDGLKEQIDATLNDFDGLGKEVVKSHEELLHDYIEVFKGHFFAHSRAPLDQYGLDLLHGRMGDWTVDFPRFVLPVLAWTDWGGMLLAGLPIWFGIWFLGRVVAGRMGVRDEPRVRLGWPLLVVGPAMYLVTVMVPFTASHVVNLAFVTMAAWGATILTRHHLEEGTLDFLLLLYALASLNQLLSLPAEGLSVLWPAVMGLAAWNRWKSGRRRLAWILAGLGAAALLGYAPQAMMAVQAWFLFLLMVAASRSLRAAFAGLGGMWPSYVLPLTVTMLAVAWLSWLLLFMGGPGFVDYVYGLELPLWKARLSLDAVAFMAVLYFAVRLGLAWLTVFLDRATVGGKPLDPALTHTLRTMAGYAIWTGYLLLALTSLGLPLGALTWIASGLSVGVGFGLKDIINNFVSGLIILFGGSIKKGDVVQTGKLLGEVTNVSVRNTTIRTQDNSMVIIPNSSFLRGEIINWSFQDKRIRLTIPVSVVPGTKVKKVRKILLGAAKEHELVLKDPAPSVLMRQFGRLGLDFELYVWIEDFQDKYRVESDLGTTIDERLQENKVTVAFQSAKVKYKPKGSGEAQAQAAREALKQKRHQVFALVRPLRRVYMRARWGMTAGGGNAGEDGH